MTQTAGRSVAEALARQLEIQGVRTAFCVPGESYLSLLDALRDREVDLLACRQEGGMAMMAEAAGKATLRPGVAFATRGPGATNAAAGVHVAYQDSTPLVLFVGQVDRAFRERDAWQELDYRRVFGGLAKWATELDDPDRVSEVTARAFHVAMSGRPGPVVVALPSDVLACETTAGDARRAEPPSVSPSAEAISTLGERLSQARRPLLLLGGTGWTDAARADVQRFAAAFSLPVATSHRRGAAYDADRPEYCGELGLSPNPRLLERIAACDLLIVLGGRLGEVPSQGYTLFRAPRPQIPLVHIFPDAEELGRVYQPDLAILADPASAAAALAALQPPAAPPWAEETRRARADYLAWSEVPTPQPGGVNLGEVVRTLRESLGGTGTLCNGAGNFAAWVNRFYRVRSRLGHIAPTSGSMGYGLPAAIAVKRLHPERRVVALCGDGDFLMTGQEFATAVQYDVPVVALVADNGSYGTIRMHQEREFPGRPVATDLVNPDFAALARAYGGHGALVERTEDFADALAAAEASGRPAVLHLKIDIEAISPGATLSQIRERALKAR